MATVIPSTTTLDDIRARVLNMINESVGGTFSYQKIDALVNQCARQIFNKTNDVYLEAYRETVVGTSEYELATPQAQRGTARVEYVEYDGDPIDAIAPVRVAADEGTPSGYWVDGYSIWLSPPPDAVGELRVRYKRDYAPASEPTDEFGVSDAALDACVLFAAYMLKIADDEYTAAGMLRSEYETALAQATSIETGVYSGADEFTYDE